MIYYVIAFLVYIGFMLFSVFSSSKNAESLSDFTTGGHRMGVLIGTGTTCATCIGAAYVLGFTGYTYQYGYATMIAFLAGPLLGMALLSILAYKARRPLLPPRTFPEYIRMRFEPTLKTSTLQILIALITFVGYFVLTYMQIVGFGTIFSTITGIDYKIAVFFFLIFLIFTSMGGFWSVAATDLLNTILIVVGIGIVAVVLVGKVGGLGVIVENAATVTAPAIEGGDPTPLGQYVSTCGPYTALALFVVFLQNTFGIAASPHYTTRMSAPKNVKTAVLQYALTPMVIFVLFCFLVVLGLTGRVLITSLPAGSTADSILPQMIKQFVHPGIGAITLVAILAAAVSSANSFLLHCATSLMYDFIRPLTPALADDEEKMKKSIRYAMLGMGLIATFFALKPPALMALVQTMVYGPLASAFVGPIWLGMFWKRYNRPACYTSIVVGVTVFISCSLIGTPQPAFLYSAPAALITSIIVTLLTQPGPVESYESYFVPDVSADTIAIMENVRHDTDLDIAARKAAQGK
ncbi:MAG: sodium:solute symporter family protein [Lachnospiraceae bacterium]|nr:sodium:solute symporter family protein [Lachnospiraceae bacterium]